MAEITLHSGSFVDRNDNEITVSFYKKSSSTQITVDPTELNFTSNGGTKTVSVSGYSGTVNVSITGGSGWLVCTGNTTAVVRTYTFVATANQSTSMKNATITFSDDNGRVTVNVTQAATTSMVSVSPNYLVFNKNGETKTATVTWVGGTTPTWSNDPDWAIITSSVSGNTMTLTINVGMNPDSYQRNATIYVSNGISRADLAIEQEAVHTVSVSPNSFSFPETGGTQVLYITNIEGSFSMNYEGDGLDVVLLDYPSNTSRRYNVTYTPNTVTSVRTGVINVRDTAGGWVAIPTSQAASSEEFAVSPTSFQYAGEGSTNTFTFTGVPAAGIGYEVPTGIDWVSVSNLTNRSVDITTLYNPDPSARTTTVKFYDLDDIDNYVTVTVNQAAGVESMEVSPMSITYLPNGGTYGITAVWNAGNEPQASITYVQGAGGWMTPAGSSVTGNVKEWAWTASSNDTGSSRTALIVVTNGLQVEQVTVSQSANPSPGNALYVRDVSMDFIAAGERKETVVENIVGTLTHTEPDWISLSMSGSGGTRLVSVHAAANSSSAARSGSVVFGDDRVNTVSMAVAQNGVGTIDPTTITLNWGYTYTGSDTDGANNIITVQGTNLSMSIIYESGPTYQWGSQELIYEWISYTKTTYSTYSEFEIHIQWPHESKYGTWTAIASFYDGDTFIGYATIIRDDSNALRIYPDTVPFSEDGGSKYITVANISGTLEFTTPNWVSISMSGTGSTRSGVMTATVNPSNIGRSGTIYLNDDRSVNVSGKATQDGAKYITVSPNRLDLYYHQNWNTHNIDVYGNVSGVNTNITYGSGDTGWLEVYVIDPYIGRVDVYARTNRTSTVRTATLTIINADYPSNTVNIPITQDPNPGTLSVTPNTYTYPSSGGTHNFTITYQGQGYVDVYTTPFVDGIHITRVSGEPGSVTWVYEISVDQNTTGETRWWDVYIDGDESGCDYITITQQG